MRDFAPNLAHYPTFVASYQRVQSVLVEKLRATDGEVARRVADVQTTQRRNTDDRRNFLSLLSGPVQRVPRYVLLLGELRKATAAEHADAAAIGEAIAAMETWAVSINEAIAGVGASSSKSSSSSSSASSSVRGRSVRRVVVDALFHKVRAVAQWMHARVAWQDAARTLGAVARSVSWDELDRIAALSLEWRGVGEPDKAAFWFERGHVDVLRRVLADSGALGAAAKCALNEPLVACAENLGGALADILDSSHTADRKLDDDTRRMRATVLDSLLGSLVFLLDSWAAMERTRASTDAAASAASASALKSVDALLAIVAERVVSAEFFALLLAPEVSRQALATDQFVSAAVPVRMVVSGDSGDVHSRSAIGWSQHMAAQIGEGLLHLFEEEKGNGVALVLSKALSGDQLIAIYDVLPGSYVSMTRAKWLKIGGVALKATSRPYSIKLNMCQDFALDVLNVLSPGCKSRLTAYLVPTMAEALWAVMPRQYLLFTGGSDAPRAFERRAAGSDAVSVNDKINLRKFDEACLAARGEVKDGGYGALGERAFRWNKAQVRAMQEVLLRGGMSYTSECFGNDEATRV
eukprot:TRINITY_DN2194_c0_g1_i2.p1 TRINITY_DN2194_c0_g1~~TRINITY_DN2194_c0_g1_i2.p1  ORF type:complete len:580 (+),score=297.99 TRINITY_DN2194_c0_g1_i2:358-2097(+)